MHDYRKHETSLVCPNCGSEFANILEEKMLCVWCKMKTGVYNTNKEEKEKICIYSFSL